MSLWAEQSSRCSSAVSDADCDLTGLFRRDVLPLGYPGDAHVHGGVNENAQVVGVIRQGIVRTAADDDAGALIGNVADGIKSSQVHLLLQGVSGAGAGQSKHIGVHGDGVQQALGTLVKIFKNLLAQAALLRCFLEKFFIIKRDAQLLGHADADFLAAAAKLPTDGNDGLHINPTFGLCIIPRFFISVI